jgi:hypothetical protein
MMVRYPPFAAVLLSQECEATLQRLRLRITRPEKLIKACKQYGTAGYDGRRIVSGRHSNFERGSAIKVSFLSLQPMSPPVPNARASRVYAAVISLVSKELSASVQCWTAVCALSAVPAWLCAGKLVAKSAQAKTHDTLQAAPIRTGRNLI